MILTPGSRFHMSDGHLEIAGHLAKHWPGLLGPALPWGVSPLALPTRLDLHLGNSSKMITETITFQALN